MNGKIFLNYVMIALAALALMSCASHRQGAVCSEIEYRLNTMSYSPEQRAFTEEELRQCREEQGEMAASEAATRKSIYERYASSGPAAEEKSEEPKNVSVSEALKDSSGVETVSIYERYGSVNSDSSAVQPVENSERNSEQTPEQSSEQVVEQ